MGSNSRTAQCHLDSASCSGIGFPKPGAARVPAFQNLEHLFTHTSDGFASLAKIPLNLVVLLRAGHGHPLHASAGIVRRFSRRLRFTGTLDERDASQDWGAFP
jgi:hypothetical protein